jgi:cytochrome c553
MRTQIVFGALAVLAVLAAPSAPAAPAPAAQTASATTAQAPNPAVQREFGAKLLVCNACHGDNGVPKSGVIPIINGQQENYLLKQLHDFRSKERTFEIMEWMSNTLTVEEQAPAATYVSKKAWPAKRAGAAAAPAAPRGIAVCQACHAQNYMGAVQAEGMTTPRLAGQNYEYLVEAMRRFADGERTNNADMAQMMKALPAADRDAMARYLSSL